MILINGVPGRVVPCLSVHGIRPPDFAALGDAPSPLANDLPALANRDDAQWLWALLPPLMATGTVRPDDQGGFEVDDPADGTWTQQYRSLVMPLTGAAQVEVSTITLIVGGVTTVPLAGSGGGSAGGSGTLGVGKPLAGTGGGHAGGSGTLSVGAPGAVELQGQGGGMATGSGALTVQAPGSGALVWPLPYEPRFRVVPPELRVTIEKSPDDDRRYGINVATHLQPGDSVNDAQVAAHSDDLDVTDPQWAGSIVSARVRGGAVGQTYFASLRWGTALGDVGRRTLWFRVVDL